MERIPRFGIEVFRAQQEWHRKQKEEADKIEIYKCDGCGNAFKAEVPFYGSVQDWEDEYECPFCDCTEDLYTWNTRKIELESLEWVRTANEPF